jgi:hypothetical protein
VTSDESQEIDEIGQVSMNLPPRTTSVGPSINQDCPSTLKVISAPETIAGCRSLLGERRAADFSRGDP